MRVRQKIVIPISLCYHIKHNIIMTDKGLSFLWKLSTAHTSFAASCIFTYSHKDLRELISLHMQKQGTSSS